MQTRAITVRPARAYVLLTIIFIRYLIHFRPRPELNRTEDRAVALRIGARGRIEQDAVLAAMGQGGSPYK